MTAAPSPENRVAPVGRVLLGLAGLLVLAVAVVADGPVRGTVNALLTLFGSEYLLVAVIGLVAFVVGVAAFVTSREAATQAATPDPERAVAVPAPGESFDEMAADWRCLLPGAGRDHRAAVQERLRRTAVEAVAVTDDCDRETAARRVAEGTWTADGVAAAYLAEQTDATNEEEWFELLVGRQTPTHYRAERTVSAIADVAGVGGEDVDDGAGEETDR
ncbi:hypothetical protein SAMN05216559_0535 [Halomicrobium zhouii]|uniref:Uncharacterized protein n=1 Tax=Halomicrobium zhouii TaxID=767519 RepID=A0A1I6KBW9_9EURY|nr:hypothetical protein [Halomicrobium zhouii]SFR88785.1 hypothetical protein SAMN05216559_0535 [Halomicrobium zhouii]